MRGGRGAGRSGVAGGPQHNNGMHPTADKTDFMLLQRFGAAGDAWR